MFDPHTAHIRSHITRKRRWVNWGEVGATTTYISLVAGSQWDISYTPLLLLMPKWWWSCESSRCAITAAQAPAMGGCDEWGLV